MRQAFPLSFFSEWQQSTTTLVFFPKTFATEVSDGADESVQRKNLEFSASSIAIAFISFQTIQRNSALWDVKYDGPPFEIEELSLWCVLSIAIAAAIKLLRGSRSPVTNTIIAVRILAVIYLPAVLFGCLGLLLDPAGVVTPVNAFYMVSILTDWLLQIVYFPKVLLKPNEIEGRKAIAFNMIKNCSEHYAGRSRSWHISWHGAADRAASGLKV